MEELTLQSKRRVKKRSACEAHMRNEDNGSNWGSLDQKHSTKASKVQVTGHSKGRIHLKSQFYYSTIVLSIV